MPTLFFYDDGTPLDERGVDRFIFQLRRSAKPAAGPADAPRRLKRLADVVGTRARQRFRS